MRILHLIHSEGVYGAERMLLYLAREQERSGHTPIIGSIRDPGTGQTPFEAQAASWGVPVVPVRIAPRPTPGVVRSLLRTIRALRPDVLHSHGYKANILLGCLPRRLRGPMLATLHGWTGGQVLSALWLYERLDRLALRSIDAVVVVTQQMLTLAAVRKLPPSQRRVIENGIPQLATRLDDLAAQGPALPSELVDFVRCAPTLVAIGRLSQEKGFTLLLEAFACARAQGAHPHRLLIVGAGPERASLMDRVASLSLTDVVRLPGYIEGADRLLAWARGFVMSSRTEGLPLVLLEAMQWQVPILATAVGAVPDVLEGGRHGRLVAPNDLAALTGGLAALMSPDGADRRPGANGGVSDRFTSERMCREYLSAYSTIIGPTDRNEEAATPAARVSAT